jgi:hypothetical protein
MAKFEGGACHAPECTAEPNGKPFMRCARCKYVCKCAYYCSAECQTAHWPGHRETCKHIIAMEKAAENPKPLTDVQRVRIARGLSPDLDS